MKKLILVLAICLMASQTFAVSVYLERQGTTNTVAVKYSDNGTTAATRMRAVALTITAPAGVTLTLDGSSYKTGESTASSKGYGIYPAQIVIDSTGNPTSYGSPLAKSTHPGSGSGNGTNNVVLEFGSLYDAAAVPSAAPEATGTLCTFTVNAGSVSNPVISMVDEDTYRGGLVMENGDQGVVSSSITFTTAVAPSPATNGTPTPNVTTATGALNTDLGWTAGANATSYDVYFGTVNPPAFVGNTTATTYEPGVLVQGQTYYVSVVAKNSDGSAEALNWSFNTDCFASTAIGYADWVAWGKPACWCFQRQCRGDINGIKSGFWVQCSI
jgi:hypothetical protein